MSTRNEENGLVLDALSGREGFLFVGDPHLWSKTPGKRLDNWPETIAGKLMQAAQIANQGRLQLVCLGDLLHDDDETDMRTLTRGARALAQCLWPPVTLVGNHERKQKKLTDDTALALLREAGSLATMEKSGVAAIFDVGGQRVGLGGTPHGTSLPSDVTEERIRHGLDWLIWLTHHDLAFDGAYPGAEEINEIRGVDMMVNGHMHKPAKSLWFGKMKAHNPGNIARLSIDTRDQEPSVWIWRPENGHELARRALEFKKDVFDLSELMGTATSESAPEASGRLEAEKSRFALWLREQSSEAGAKTSDAQDFKKDLEKACLETKAPDAVKALLYEALNEALADKKA